MSKKKKIKIWLLLGIVFLGIYAFNQAFSSKSSIKADFDARQQIKESITKENCLIVTQNEEFPDITTKSGRNQVLSKKNIPSPEKDFSYEYSDSQGKTINPNSTEVGYQEIYVKITNKQTKVNKYILIPVTVADETMTLLAENKVVLQVDDSQGQMLFQVKEVENKSPKELQQFVMERTKARAWKADTGEELSVRVSSTTIDPSTVGNYKATLEVTLSKEIPVIQMEKDVIVQENERILNPAPATRVEDGITWIEINSRDDVSMQNDFEKGTFKIKSGTRNMNAFKSDSLEIVPVYMGYRLDDGIGSMFGRLVATPTFIPSKNGSLLPSISERGGIGTTYRSSDGKRFKTETLDWANQLKYIHEVTIAPNQSYRVQTRIENVSAATVNLGFINKGMVGAGGISFATNYFLTSLGNGRGIRGQFTKDIDQNQTVFAIDFKPRVADPYTYWDTKESMLAKDWIEFNKTALKPGMETNKIRSGENIFDKKGIAYYYSAGVPEKPVASGGSVSATWDLFFGEALPYISIAVEPEEYNVYQDTPNQEFKYNYTLGNIPTVDDYGTMTITYPDDSKENKPFTGRDLTGAITLPRSKLPTQLNDRPGTIKTYETSVLAINEAPGVWQGLPSEDKYLNLNVYNLGGTPIAQIIKKDSAWNKTADSLIKDPVILPGHKASFDYVDKTKPVDSSKVGLQFAEIRMTDTNEPSRTAIIKVPVMVMDGTIPTTGLMVGANDFSIDKSQLTGLTDEQLKNLILKESNAVGWEVSTGLTEGIDLSVSATTLTNSPDITKKYTATIKATKDSLVKEAKINITVTAKSNLKIRFVDEKGEDVASPIDLQKNVASKVDLTKEDAVLAAIKEQTDLGYLVTERPENETAYPIAEMDQTIYYRFKTESKLTVEFINGKNDVLNSVELTEKIGRKVDLTKEIAVQTILTALKGKGYVLLESPENEVAYPMTNNDTQKVVYRFKTESQLTVKFVNEDNSIIDSKDTIELVKEIGVPIDLTQEVGVKEKIDKYKGKRYVLIESPTPEIAYPITADDQTIFYKFQTKSKLIINFIDENNDMLKTLELTKEIGVPVDLSKNLDVMKVLEGLKIDNRVLEQRPLNETSYPIDGTNEPVYYRFRSNSKLIIKFVNVNDDSELLKPSVELMKRIGSNVNIREEADVAAVIKELEDVDHYELIAFPKGDTDFTVTSAAERELSYIFEVEADFNVQFVDEENTVIETLPLIRRIGSLDLSKDSDILAAIKSLEGMNYEVIKRPPNETNYPIRPVTESAIYRVKKMEVPVKIRFVNEDGVDIDNVDPINSTAIIGSILDLKVFETEIQKRLKLLEAEHYELVESPVDQQTITEPLELFYRFKGSLFISSFPETLDFGDKYLTSKLIKGEQPKYNQDLIIKDTRKNKSAWKLSATLETPLTSAENASEVIRNVFYYRTGQGANDKIQLLEGQTEPIEVGNTTTGEYNISDKWTQNKTGLELSVYSNKVYQTGKYTASILWQVEETP
ncbi:hypothetical protein A5821_002145 [Enterococcus sp. 7F3_DIV0205]|uniref:MucBP domain-containing protein n=1 Tax=Candidatus Enterococcus palustris TaxID=1834189 RepID=A0AAQ3W996_9ENTE|nr:hypothetical protein [Enterococcus sp. 7F3_DIV0205]OTN82584.1 hypothetical protein A5821_002495 [Enterococcus sp. 7F3_DIV0205]